MERALLKAAEIINKNAEPNIAERFMPYCTIATVDNEGYPHITTITPVKADGMKWITFSTGLQSGKAQRLLKNKRASVCFSAEEYNISLVGDIEILTDEKNKKENWYYGLQEHFSGYQDENFCVLKFTTKEYDIFIGEDFAKGTL